MSICGMPAIRLLSGGASEKECNRNTSTQEGNTEADRKDVLPRNAVSPEAGSTRHARALRVLPYRGRSRRRRGRRLPDRQRAELESLRAQALGETEPDEPVLEAFVELKSRYGIADEEVAEFLDAMATDITTSRYETYDDLESYMRGSAAAVGVMMTAIMEPEMEETALPAIKLGEAFQLTNFLRDVREDVVDRDRIYLPQETLRTHGASSEQIERLEFSGSPRRWQTNSTGQNASTGRASPVFATCPPTVSFRSCSPPSSTPNTTPSSESRVRRSLDRAVAVDDAKARLRRETRWHWHWNRDPEAVFQRVSAVPMAEADARGRATAGRADPVKRTGPGVAENRDLPVAPISASRSSGVPSAPSRGRSGPS